MHNEAPLLLLPAFNIVIPAMIPFRHIFILKQLS